MITMTLAEVAAAVGGTLGGGADPAGAVTGPVEFDSRQVRSGGLFLALAGEQVDGHDFVAPAYAGGVVAAVVTRPVAGPYVLVADGRAAIAALAAHVARALLPGLTIIAITGSAGKTSTKDLVAHLLGELGPTVFPPGSYNNELGHPYTVLLSDERTKYLVLEISARGIGHISYLSRVAPPRIGVVLNVGTAHLGEFGSRAAIAQAKGELVEALPTATVGGIAVLNIDDPLVRAMAARTSARVVTVGESSGADVRAEDVGLDAGGRPSFDLVTAAGRARVGLQLVGGHQVGNALAAAAVALESGLSPAQIAASLGRATATSRWRMQVGERTDGITVINDAYNASPESVRAALKTLAGIRAGGRRVWAVLGPMAELGPAGPEEHDGIGRLAVRLGIDKLIAVGEPARRIYMGASLEGSWDGEAAWEPDIATTLVRLRADLRRGDVVLVKGSRTAGLERLAQALLDEVAT